MYKIEELDLFGDEAAEENQTEDLATKLGIVVKTNASQRVSIADISISLGAPWISEEIYSEFIKYLLGLPKNPTVIFNRELGTYKIEIDKRYRETVSCCLTYGTRKMDAISIIDHILNCKAVVVYDYPINNGVTERVLNKTATLEAQEKEKLINIKFERWIKSDYRRCCDLEDKYNYLFVRNVKAVSYDGSNMKLADLNPEVKLYPYQANAIARVLVSPENVLLAHEVGTGKTYIICVSAHELHRLNISKKNLVVVPNAVLDATIKAHKYLYPNDKILAVYPKDFTPATRNNTLEKIRDNDYVAVYMASSSFDMIEMSKKYWLGQMEDEIDSLRKAAKNSTYTQERKSLERAADKLSKKMLKYFVEGKDKPWLTFDKLGVEALFVDEAHHYKNVPINTRISNIVGLNKAGAEKSRQMLAKASVVKKVVFATGTPLTNSLAELFVLQKYLQPKDLEFRTIDTFDLWAQCFAKKVEDYEMDVDHQKLRSVTRFSKFHNLPELMMLFSTVCDFYKSAEADNDLPEFKGYTDIIVAKTEAQEDYMRKLSNRIDEIRARNVRRDVDNMLKVTCDGKLCAVDPRLVNPNAKILAHEETKVGACAKQVYKLYCDYPGTCQIIFSDVGTPKSSFNVYDEAKRELIKLGVQEDEIAFIHDATTEKAREKLFALMNEGIVRVVIGSTDKLGEGVNVQQRLIAEHHLSVPWRPSDLVQREGRILRQGNTCKEVFVYRYITSGTFDGYLWQLLQNKQVFISDFLTGVVESRDTGDIDQIVLTYAEAKALAIGNQLIRTRMETANELERAKINCRQRQRQLIELREVVQTAPDKISKYKQRARQILNDIRFYESSREKIDIDERLAFGEDLLEALKDNAYRESERVFDTYQGFTVILPKGMDEQSPYVNVCSPNGGAYPVDMATDKPMGCSMRLDRLFDNLPKRAKALRQAISETRRQRDTAIEDINKGNKYENEVDLLTEKLREIDEQLVSD